MKSMKVSFTTLACPKWSWTEVLDNAVALGYDGIEIRGIGGELCLGKLEPFFPENISATMKQLSEKNLELSCLDTSSKFHEQTSFDSSLQEGREAIDLAQKLNCKFIRVFGDRIPEGESESSIIQQIASGLNQLGDYALGKGVTVLVETHGDFSTGEAMQKLLEHVTSSAVAVLWDLSNGYIEFNEPIAVTFQMLSSRILHTHLKDAKGKYPDAELCLFGQGDLPAKEMIDLLKSIDYQGWLSLEFEKMWHPELEEPEVSLAVFIREMRKVL
jgi:sugar phosphate isomerase/epimerase